MLYYHICCPFCYLHFRYDAHILELCIISKIDRCFNSSTEYSTVLHDSTSGPLCKQLDEQLSKVLGFLEHVKEFNSSVEYIENVDLNQRLAPAVTQSDVHELSERLRTMTEQLEYAVAT